MPLSAEGSAFVEFIYRMVQEGMTDDDLRQELRNYDIEPYLDRMSKILEARNADLTKKMIQSHLWADPDVYGHIVIAYSDVLNEIDAAEFPNAGEHQRVLFIDPDYMKDLFYTYILNHSKWDDPERQYRFIYDSVQESKGIIYADNIVDANVSGEPFWLLLITVHNSEKAIENRLQEILRKKSCSWNIVRSVNHIDGEDKDEQ